jgi:hypothetical protein
MSESTKSVDPLDYGVAIPQAREPIVQEDGCKYDNFVFQTSQCGRSWRLSWGRTHPDGRRTRGSITMAGNPTDIIHVNKGDLS